jgi:hypothetical protein
MPIGLGAGLGIGGGRSSTSSGAPGGGGGGFTDSASVDFDGVDDHATLASTITLSGNKSVSFWMYLDSVSGFRTIAARNATSYSFLFNGSSSVYVRAGTPQTFTGSGYSLSAGTWTHMAVTGDGSDLICYLNGTAVGGTQADGGNLVMERFFEYNSSAFFDGKIDELALFNTTLSPTDVATIANTGAAAGSKAIDLSGYSPVHWWRMGDINGSSGTTIADQGSGGVAMTLVNGPAYSVSVP